jgi:uncharacterized membrane protein
MIPLWLLTVIYVAVSFMLGLTLPRLEVAYSPHFGHDISVSSAQALLASIASGMMSLTAIVFSIGFVVSQLVSARHRSLARQPDATTWRLRTSATEPIALASLPATSAAT